MRRTAKWVVVLLAFAGLAGAGLAKLLERAPLQVDVFRVERGDVRSSVTSPSSGTVVSAREATVAAEASGRVDAVLLDAGDRADGGAAIIVLDETEAAIEVRAAQAALATRKSALEGAQVRLAKAEQDLAAWEALERRKLVSDDQFRAAKALRDGADVDVEAARRAVREAEVAVERAEAALARRQVRAPFKGVIRRRLVEVGEFVAIGAPCFEIYDDSRIFVRAPVDEVDVPRVRPGLAARIMIEAFGERVFPGLVREIEPGVRIERELNRTAEVEVDFHAVEGAPRDPPQAAAGGNPRGAEAGKLACDGEATKRVGREAANGAYPPGEGPVRIGMSADIEIVTETRRGVLRVPHYAVHEDADRRTYVFLFDGGVIAKRIVRVGLGNWDYAEIAEGLGEGDPVVVSLDLEGLDDGVRAVIRREVGSAQVD